MRLRRSVLSTPGIARKRRGKGFAYYGPKRTRPYRNGWPSGCSPR